MELLVSIIDLPLYTLILQYYKQLVNDIVLDLEQ